MQLIEEIFKNDPGTSYQITIFEILIYFNCNISLFVLEYNGSICTEKNWNTIYISNNDRIELITIVGGG